MEKIVKQFIKLVKLPGNSGNEKELASYLNEEFKRLGWKTWVDDSGIKNQSNTGNLYAFFEASPGFKTLVFCAHMDTVIEPNKIPKVIFDGKTFRSDGTTILGADNRAGICALLLAAKQINILKLKHNLLFFFPTREEAGRMGSSFFLFDQKKLKYIFDLDSTDRPGVFITSSYGYINFSIKIIGKAAHAAQSFEKGKNAIVAAAYLIKKLPIGGNHKTGWSMNVGKVNGGTGTNVIPDKVILHGEIRAKSTKALRIIQNKVVKICKDTAKIKKIKIEFIAERASFIPPFIASRNPVPKGGYLESARKAGLSPYFKTSYSTYDANFLSQTGVPTIEVSRGGKNPHSKNESISMEEIKQTIKLVCELIHQPGD